jgi:DNA polymerase III subunit epsilon
MCRRPRRKYREKITKTVIWVATSTPDANDAPHRAARTYQVPMLSPVLARQRLDEAIRDADLKAFERQRAVDEWAAQRQAREDYWRPTWRPIEIDYDPAPLHET